MHILQSWKESIALFKPANFYLFLLVSIRSFGLALKSLFLYWGWLIILFWTYDYLVPDSLLPYARYVDFTFRGLLLYLFIYSLRPSAPIKNASYYANMFAKYWYSIPIVIGLYWINSLHPELNMFLDISLYICFSLVLTLFVLFFTDSDGSFKSFALSIVRACKMFIYNLPWFIIIAFVFTLLEGILLSTSLYFAQFSDSVVTMVYTIIQSLLYGFHIALLANFYVKRLYDQIELYFTLP